MRTFLPVLALFTASYTNPARVDLDFLESLVGLQGGYLYSLPAHHIELEGTLAIFNGGLGIRSKTANDFSLTPKAFIGLGLSNILKIQISFNDIGGYRIKSDIPIPLTGNTTGWPFLTRYVKHHDPYKPKPFIRAICISTAYYPSSSGHFSMGFNLLF
jgi:hypothetical protein